MSIRYNKIKKFPRTFNRLFGVQVDQFEEILKKTEPEWETRVIRRYKRPGRPFKCELSDMILMLLLYYHSYTRSISRCRIQNKESNARSVFLVHEDREIPMILKTRILKEDEYNYTIGHISHNPIRPRNISKSTSSRGWICFSHEKTKCS